MRVDFIIKQTMFLSTGLKSNFLRPSTLLRTSNAVLTSRFISTDRMTPSDEQKVLVNQRKQRPMSPHLTVYKKQLTFNLSGAHRIFGVAMAGTLYGGLIAYAALPLIGYPVTVEQAADLWSQVPYLVKLGTKMTMAFPFAFHMYNGVRHLVWDSGKLLSLSGVYKTGYAVLGVAGLTTLYLALN